MISDMLSNTVAELDRYLNDPVFADAYDGLLHEDLRELRAKIESMRQRLDAPPPTEEELP